MSEDWYTQYLRAESERARLEVENDVLRRHRTRQLRATELIVEWMEDYPTGPVPRAKLAGVLDALLGSE